MKRLLTALLVLSGCGALPIDNAKQGTDPVQPIRWRVDSGCLQDARQMVGETRNMLAPVCNEPNRRDLVTLSLSGGGAKATIFSGEALFYLQFLGLLDRTSIISSVSGGSFAAATYALSCDPGTPCTALRPEGRVRPMWRHDDILRTFAQGNKDVVDDQIGRVFVPFLPSSISAGRFGYLIDRDYFAGGSGQPFTFADLNPARPHLFLNATITSDNRGGLGSSGSRPGCSSTTGRHYLRRRTTDEYFHFAFSDYYFGLLNSRLASYPLAAGVAASGAFPALIDNAVLHDWCGEPGRDDKIRLMDGGANDNQALVEIYLVLSELVFGQHRSDLLIRRPPGLDVLGPSDRAFLFAINSAVTETTGTSASGDDPPSYGVAGLLSQALSKSLAAIDVYSAEGYALRKQSYIFQGWILRQLPGFAPIYPSEISLTALDQYALGGTEAALRYKADLQDEGQTDIAQSLAELRTARQQRAYDALVEDRAARQSLGLSDWHPQCYYDMRRKLDASLISLSDDDQACLREAARWSVALRSQEMCGADPKDPIVARPDGLRCVDGRLQPGNPGGPGAAEPLAVLGVPGALPGRCHHPYSGHAARRSRNAGRPAARPAHYLSRVALTGHSATRTVLKGIPNGVPRSPRRPCRPMTPLAAPGCSSSPCTPTGGACSLNCGSVAPFWPCRA